jgi:beta-N-acetylhexosaminidase
MSSPEDFAVLCGALLVSGFPGPKLDADTVRALASGHRAGVILFRRNVDAASIGAVHSLCSEILQVSPHSPGPFIAVDQEGGRVMRLGAPVVQLPPMRVLGDIGDAMLSRRAGRVLGIELSAIGFNLNFAPVLDVDSNPDNPVIGDRSFSRDPAKVGELGAAFAEGLEIAGVLACAKHFPGHGDTDRDSHVELPHVLHARERLDTVEIVPFRRAVSSVGSMMTAHVVYDGLDPSVPATCSGKIVTELLRHDLGFKGLVFSDDLEMRALADHGSSIEESSVAAVRAGCDVLLVCKDFELAERAHAALVRECERDLAFVARCTEAKARCDAARRKFRARPAPDVVALKHRLGDSGGAELLEEIARRQAN